MGSEGKVLYDSVLDARHTTNWLSVTAMAILRAGPNAGCSLGSERGGDRRRQKFRWISPMFRAPSALLCAL